MSIVAVLNNVSFTKKDVIKEIQSSKMARYESVEPIYNNKKQVVGQRFHFVAPQNVAERLGDFFDVKVKKKDNYSYCIDFKNTK